MTTLRFIFQYIKRHRLQYILGIITLFIVDIANVFIPKMTGNITDGLKAGNIDWAGITHYLLILFLLGLTLAVGRFLWRYFLFGASRSIEKELRNDMFAHLETMDVEFYNQNKTGDLMTRFTSDLNSIRMAIGMAVICVFDAVVMSAMVIVQMMHYVDVRLTLMAVIPMLFILFGELYYGKVIMARFKARQEAVSDLTDFVQESFSGIRVIKAFVREKAQRYAFARENQKNLEKNLDIARMQSVVMPLLDVIIGLSSLITLLFGGYLAVNGQISLGRFVAFNQYINMLVWPMLACGEAVNMFSMGGASLKRVKAVFDAEPEVKDPQNGDEGIRAAEEVPVQEHEIVGHIRLEHLTFTHQDSNEPVLNDITLDVPAGTTLAIVSKTGGGKSTLVNLLLHLYNTKRGMIFIDNRDINDIPLNELRENIAYVPPDNSLSPDSVRSNISFGVEDEDMEEIVAATKAACIHDSIAEFPDGYETIVGERGVTLSGGQKQRSSIARALMKDAPILILDDALSAVDTDTEEQILENLKVNRRGKTTILIAHRVSTIQNADRIMVLEDGKAKEIGNHEELMRQDGIYHGMVEQQQLEAVHGEAVRAAGFAEQKGGKQL